MIKFDFNQNCCGCTACVNSCAKGAITMQQNDEGFMMPVVDESKCVDCGLCDKVCPHLNTSEDRSNFSLESFKDKKSYLYYSNKLERKDSASGGFVYDAMKAIVDNGGLACGCVWDENLRAVHIVSDKQEDLLHMQSSKYVQSDMQGCYKEIKVALKSGRKVVFCGTPCQTAGLKHYLGKADKTNLISICLICHGVASPGVWDRWKTVMEKKHHGKLIYVNMRDKSYKGYSTSYSKYTFIDKKKSEPLAHEKVGHASHGTNVDKSNPHTSLISTRNVGMPTYLADPYIFLFTDDLYLRHSCNQCQYKADNNGADIIVGDFYASTEGAGNLGCSCVIAMNEKGPEFIDSLDGTIKKSSYIQVGSVNSMLWKSVKEHPNRTAFFERYKAETEPSERLFTDFLPMKFKVKKVLNQLGLFSVARKLLGK